MYDPTHPPTTTPRGDAYERSDSSVLYAPSSGPRLFRPFTDVRGPGAPASSADTRRFLCLPAAALAFPFVHSRGRAAGHVRWEAAVLSAMAWLWAQSRGHAEVFEYHDGVAVEVGEQEFVASIETVARTLWARFNRRSFVRGAPAPARFDRFYEQVRKAVGRLQASDVDGVPLLRLLGPARTDVPGKASDLFGQRWTMAGSVVDRSIDGLAPCGAPEVLFYEDTERLYGEILQWREEGEQGEPLGSPAHLSLWDKDYVQESLKDELVIDVARVYDVLTAWDFQVHDRLVEAAAKTGGLHWKERPVSALPWQRRRARGLGWGGAHLTVGAWQKGQATSSDRRELRCAVPFLVADVDGATPYRSLLVAWRLLGRLVELGVRPKDLVVSYTGGRGFHVRIPHGLLGRPLWPRAGDVKPVIARFFDRLCEGLVGPNGPLARSLDSSLFAPMHLVRAVGSEHEKYPGRRCVGYRGDEFLELLSVLGDSALDVVEADSASPEPRPFPFPSPDRPAPVPALVDMLLAAVRDVRDGSKSGSAWSPSGDQESRGVIAAIRRGVRPSEEFAPGHVGRNKAALLYSVYLLTNGRLGEPAAWAELERWNGANPVPLGEADRDDEGELERLFDKSLRYVTRGGRSHSASGGPGPGAVTAGPPRSARADSQSAAHSSGRALPSGGSRPCGPHPS